MKNKSSPFLFALFALSVNHHAVAGGNFLNPDDFSKRVLDLATSEEKESDIPTTEDPPKKKPKDPLLEMILARSMNGIQTPENIRTAERNRLRNERWLKRDENSPWGEYAIDGKVMAQFHFQPSYTQVKTSSPSLNANKPSMKIGVELDPVDGAELVGTTTSLAHFGIKIGTEITEGSRGMSQVRASIGLEGAMLYFTDPRNLKPEQRRFGMAGGFSGRAGVGNSVDGAQSALAYGAVHLGPDLQRLFIGKSSAITQFQFLPTVAFVTGYNSIDERAYRPDGERDDETLLRADTPNNVKPSLGVIGKLFIRPGVAVDVLWLRSSGLSAEKIAALDGGDATNGNEIFRGSVMIRIGKRLSLTGNYDWTTFESIEHTQNKKIEFNKVRIDQSRLGLSILLGN